MQYIWERQLSWHWRRLWTSVNSDAAGCIWLWSRHRPSPTFIQSSMAVVVEFVVLVVFVVVTIGVVVVVTFVVMLVLVVVVVG